MRFFETLPDSQDTHELLSRIESKDRGFRIARVTLLILGSIGLILLLVMNYQIQETDHQLLDNQTQTLERIQKSSNQRTAQLNDLQQHIDCVVALFQRPNRSQLVITDIEECNLDTVQQQSSQQPSSTPAPSPTVTQPTKTEPTPTPAPATKPTQPSFVCTVTLGLLGCTGV